MLDCPVAAERDRARGLSERRNCSTGSGVLDLEPQPDPEAPERAHVCHTLITVQFSARKIAMFFILLRQARTITARKSNGR